MNEAGRREEREAAREQGLDAARVAERFEVSRKAMPTRLRGLGLLERHSDRWRVSANENGPETRAAIPTGSLEVLGADDGSRTRDLQLGKLTCCQLHYIRPRQ